MTTRKTGGSPTSGTIMSHAQDPHGRCEAITRLVTRRHVILSSDGKLSFGNVCVI
jgi:hypothetical protein